jgi:hypothetical protein
MADLDRVSSVGNQRDRAEGFGHRIERCLAPAEHVHVRALLAQTRCGCCPDAGAAARDERYVACEPRLHAGTVVVLSTVA